MPDTKPKQDFTQWIKETQEAATLLLQRSEATCQKIFDNGDLTGFLTLLTRFSNYDYHNLLLLLEQYPTATKLGAFKAWKSLLPNPAMQVLKDEWKGKGLDFLAPFTVKQNGKYALVWYTVKQFDVSQTNIRNCPPSYTPYVQDEHHLSFLVSAAQACLSYLFQRSLLLHPPTSPVLPPELPFLITENAVLMRSGESDLRRLQNLTEAISKLSAVRSSIPSEHHTLFVQSTCHCLFSIWGLADSYPAPASGSSVTGMPEQFRGPFLDLLQRTVRQVEETIACAYLEKRKNDLKDDLDEELAQLLSL